MATIVITGANRGIGLELVQQFREKGHSVVGVCRQTSAGLAESGARVIDGVDVARAEGVQRLVQELGHTTVDILINNAGILRRDGLQSVDAAAVLEQFEVNALAPLMLTVALIPKLSGSAKVAMITSRMGSIADNTSGGYYGYRMSKAALNMACMSLARDLKARGVAVGILHPGMVATEMTGGHGIPVQESARGLIARIDELHLDNSGTFWHANGEILPW